MRKIIIFGANSAIAQACARLWMERGNDLYLVGRDHKKLEALKTDLKLRGRSRVESFTLDLKNTEQHAALFKDAKDKLGSIDTIFLAHGILGDQKLAEANFKHASEILEINLLSSISLLTLGANEFEAQGKGQIAVITSVAGDRGRQSNYLYGTSKGALSIFLSGLRNRLASKRIGVTDLKLGFVDTPMTHSFKKGALWQKPESVAKKIVRAIDSNKSVAYTPWFWFWIMLIIKNIPEAIFKKLKL